MLDLDFFWPDRKENFAGIGQNGEWWEFEFVMSPDFYGEVVAVAIGNLTGKEIGLADEVGNEVGFGVIVEIVDGAELFDFTFIHQGDPIGHDERFLLIVGDKNEGDAEFCLQIFQFDLHVLAELGIEGGEGFVEKEDLGAADEGAGESYALALPA